MRCGKLTLPQIALLAFYVLILGGIDELGLRGQPIIILAIGLSIAVAFVLLRGPCAARVEGW
jgi:hypothetical protein